MYSLLGWGVCPFVPGVGVGAWPVTTPGTLVTVKGVGDCPGGGVGKPIGPGVGAHCGTLQQIGSWGSTTSVQPAGTGLYTLHLQRQHGYVIPAKRRCTPYTCKGNTGTSYMPREDIHLVHPKRRLTSCTCKGNTGTLYMPREDMHLAPAKTTRVCYTCQEKKKTLHLKWNSLGQVIPPPHPPREDIHLAPAKGTRVRYTCQEKTYTLHLKGEHWKVELAATRRHTPCT